MIKLVYDKLQPESLHVALVKELQASMDEDYSRAARGECINGMDLASSTEAVIGEHLPPHIQTAVFVSRLVQTLSEVMPDRYQPHNSGMESQVSSRGLKLPPHAHLRASSSGG
jgi:hypothetical protein